MENKVNLKTPISYYGGKQTMLKHILPLLPEHKIYVEPFFGGGAVYWAKQPSKVEVINDFNGMVVNFYEQMKTNFTEIKRMVDATLYSRQTYVKAMVVYQNPYIFTPEVKAWAFWVVTNQGFSNQIGSWCGSITEGKVTTIQENRKQNFTKELSERLTHTAIECTDAVELIRKTDTEQTFFYIDPPYVGANQAHYGGYLQQHFDNLLQALSNLKGKFLLSSYPNAALQEHSAQQNWHTIEITRNNASSRQKKQQTEVLTANYSITNTL